MIVDIIILAAFVLSVLIAFFRGFIKEALTIIGFFGGFLAAYFFGPMLSPLILDLLTHDGATAESEKLFGVVPMPLASKILGYGAVFLTFSLVLSLISHTLSSVADTLGLGPVDRALGGAFGFVRAALLIGLLYLPFYYFLEVEQKQAWFGDSYSYDYLEWSAATIDQYLPERDVADTEAKENEADNEAAAEIEDASESEPATNPAQNIDIEGYEDQARESLDVLIENLNEAENELDPEQPGAGNE